MLKMSMGLFLCIQFRSIVCLSGLRIPHEITSTQWAETILERCRRSQKAPRPYGEAYLWLGASLLLGHIARYAPSSHLALITMGFPIALVIL
jgi:hypothetical protein